MAAGIFFFFFLFGNKKVLGLGEILCATAVPRGALPPPSLPLPPVGEGEGGIWAGVNVGGKNHLPSPQTWKKKLSRAGGRSASRGRHATRLQSRPGGPERWASS